jgi:hypothetical protein
VAASIAGAPPEGAVGSPVFPAMFFALGVVFSLDVAGTALRVIGRGFGSGTFGLTAASAAHADNPTASARPVAHIVDRKAAAREDWVTTFLRGESFGRSSSRSI